MSTQAAAAQYSAVLADAAALLNDRVALMEGRASAEVYAQVNKTMTQLCGSMHLGTPAQQEVAAKLIAVTLDSIKTAEMTN